MSASFNYKHLYYFWVVAKEGGFARAADRLQMAVQTISAQVRELEKSLGHQLLKPSGRGVALTEAGQAAYARAEAIFQLGECITQEVREAASSPVTRLSVGLSDGISKLAAHALLEPVLATFAIHQPRAWIHQQIDYLVTMAAVTVVNAGTVKIATLTELGRRHIDRHYVIEGVKRPSRPGA